MEDSFFPANLAGLSLPLLAVVHGHVLYLRNIIFLLPFFFLYILVVAFVPDMGCGLALWATDIASYVVDVV